jgi:hypothetical protein
LAEIDRLLERVALLWVPRPPAALRQGIGGALDAGIKRAYGLGQALALLAPPDR